MFELETTIRYVLSIDSCIDCGYMTTSKEHFFFMVFYFFNAEFKGLQNYSHISPMLLLIQTFLITSFLRARSPYQVNELILLLVE